MDKKLASIYARSCHAQKTPEWLRARAEMITASDAASVIGLNRYKNRRGLLAEKLRAHYAPDGTGRVWSSKATSHGNKYEPVALRAYEVLSGTTFRDDFGLVRHATIPWVGASPDGVSSDGATLLEIKCPYTRTIVPGQVPLMYIPQVQMAMEVCDVDKCAFVQYKPAGHNAPGDDAILDCVMVERDLEWWETHLPAYRAFHAEMMDLRDPNKYEAYFGQPPPAPSPVSSAFASEIALARKAAAARARRAI